jgi:uncharacterized repeat protein (TIGR01451 family)
MMNRFLTLFFLILSAAVQGRPAFRQEEGPLPTGPDAAHRYTETVPVYDAAALGLDPVVIPASEPLPAGMAWGGGSTVPAGQPLAPITKSGPTFLHPGATARYEITVVNTESVTRTVALSDTLPPQLVYVPGSADGLAYEPTTRTLSWKGELAPGGLEMVISPAGTPLPYLDLADFGAANLCDEFVSAGGDCDDVTLTFNLGVNGYSATLYSQTLYQITLSSNGLALGAMPETHSNNQWLPEPGAPSFLLAGLWRDVDMTAAGRWHAAIISGLVAGHDVFYAQWHDAPHADDADLTARHAIALVLDGGALDGHAFFIYDNVSDPAGMVARGYTIGVEDKPGQRGATFAYASCCGDPYPPRGYPPAPGTTLHLFPVLFGAGSAYSRTFSYEAAVRAAVPETIANTAFYRSDSTDPTLARGWSTHYLYVRQQTFLPVVHAAGAGE